MPKNKSQIIYDQLVNLILSGKYVYGDSFLSTKDLRERYGISYVTSCRLLQKLAGEGYLLSRRRSSGYTVCYVSADHRQSRKILNFITENASAPLASAIISHGSRKLAALGWTIRIHEAGVHPCLEDLLTILNDPGSYSILVSLNIPWEHFAATIEHLQNRVFVIGLIMYNQQISSVTCDEEESAVRILNHLFRQGRRLPAIVVQHKSQGLENIRLAAWRKYLLQHNLDFDWIERHIFIYDRNKESMEEFYRRLLRDHGRTFDSILVPACPRIFADTAMKLGFRIPQDIQIVTIAAPANIPESNPENILFLDNNPKGHMDIACRIMEYRFNTGQRENGYLFFCRPGKILS